MAPAKTSGRSPKVYYHGRRNRPTVALTFDDGPNPPRTDEILEILASRRVRATFFVIGKWVERWPDAFECIRRAGHVIGNHSYSHDNPSADFDRAEAVIQHFTGTPSSFLRAPYFDTTLCCQSAVALSPSVKIVACDVGPGDWLFSNPDDIVDRCLDGNVRGGSIIDLHDGAEIDNDAERLARPRPLVTALPRIIDGLISKGYRLVGLDEMELVEGIGRRIRRFKAQICSYV
jgi:peptidoglycan/xylan/chitin deacetylase (PgdA/CDA1 family)